GTARRQPAFVGGEAMLGAVGEVREELAPEGLVFVQGALWKATAEKPIPAGSTVRVVGRQGLELQVAPENGQAKEQVHADVGSVSILVLDLAIVLIGRCTSVRSANG